MFCPRLSENFPFSFYFLKNVSKLQKLSVFRGKIHHNYCPATTGREFSPKFVFDTKMQ